MLRHSLLCVLLPCLVYSVSISSINTTGNVKPLSVASTLSLSGDLKAWTDYHKQSGRLNSILTKCYECMSDREESYHGEGNAALNSFFGPRYTDTGIGSIEFHLMGPEIRTGTANID